MNWMPKFVRGSKKFSLPNKNNNWSKCDSVDREVLVDRADPADRATEATVGKDATVPNVVLAVPQAARSDLPRVIRRRR